MRHRLRVRPGLITGKAKNPRDLVLGGRVVLMAGLMAVTMTSIAPAVAETQTPSTASAETPAAPDVIQIVTFRFQPGRTADAIRIFAERAVPLYEQNPHMLEFRAFREVESPEALDLVVISHFRGMAGMDRSNQELRAAAADRGTSIGAVYGDIAALSVGHTDEFVEIDDVALASIDEADLVVLEYLRSERAQRPRRNVASAMWMPSEAFPGPSGPVLIGDGWSHLRMYGATSLGALQRIWSDPAFVEADANLAVSSRKRVVLAPVAQLSVR